MGTEIESSLKGRVVLITGASQGMGRAIAVQLAQEGLRLVLTARSMENLQQTVQLIRNIVPAAEILLCPADLQDPVAIERLVHEAEAHFKTVDILVNNAGMAGKIGLLQENTVESILKTVALNLTAPMLLMKHLIPAMSAQQYGFVININSVAGKTAYPYWALYDATKFGLYALTEAVGEEQRTNHVKVVGIYPGAVDTPIWDTISLDAAPERVNMLSPQSVAEAVLYILKQPSEVYIPELTLKPTLSVL